MVQPLLPVFCAMTVQKRPPEGGDEGIAKVQWTFAPKNARPVAGLGGGRCPAARYRALIPG
jgi:hypothetical protein